jgi:hypothetical protein
VETPSVGVILSIYIDIYIWKGKAIPVSGRGGP